MRGRAAALTKNRRNKYDDSSSSSDSDDGYTTSELSPSTSQSFQFPHPNQHTEPGQQVPGVGSRANGDREKSPFYEDDHLLITTHSNRSRLALNDINTTSPIEEALEEEEEEEEEEEVIDKIDCDYFVVKSSDSKIRIRVHGKSQIYHIYRVLKEGPFKRGAFLSACVRNGTSELNKEENAKLRRVFFDENDVAETQEIPHNSCLIYIDNNLVYNASYQSICDTLEYSKVETLTFQKPQLRPSRKIRCLQSLQLIGKVIRHKIVCTKWFANFILIAIIINTIFLAMTDPLADDDDPLQMFIAQAEYVFFAIFLLEMILKMLGLGLYGKYYDPWLRNRALAAAAVDPIHKKKSCISKCTQCTVNALQCRCCPCCKECGRRVLRCWAKLYTKCAERGWLGQNKKIAIQRFQTRSNSNMKIARSLSLRTLRNLEANSSAPDLLSNSTTNPLGGDVDFTAMSPIGQHNKHKKESISSQKPNPEDFYYYGYFPSGWNIMDFIIVISGALSLMDFGNLSAIRIIRVLRPLRSISRIPELRNLINTVFASLKELSNVLILMLFLFVIFGIVGIQMFNGALHHVCFNVEDTDHYMTARGLTPGEYDILTENDWFNGLENASYILDHVGIYDYCHEPLSYQGCDDGEEAICLAVAPNPNSGLTSWDSIGAAILSQFIMITFDGWTTTMYMMQDAVSPYVWPYFFIVTFICALFALQLNLAVLVTEYQNNSGEEQEEPKKKKKKKRHIRRVPSFLHSPNVPTSRSPSPFPLVPPSGTVTPKGASSPPPSISPMVTLRSTLRSENGTDFGIEMAAMRDTLTSRSEDDDDQKEPVQGGGGGGSQMQKAQTSETTQNNMQNGGGNQDTTLLSPPDGTVGTSNANGQNGPKPIKTEFTNAGSNSSASSSGSGSYSTPAGSLTTPAGSSSPGARSTDSSPASMDGSLRSVRSSVSTAGLVSDIFALHTGTRDIEEIDGDDEKQYQQFKQRGYEQQRLQPRKSTDDKLNGFWDEGSKQSKQRGIVLCVYDM